MSQITAKNYAAQIEKELQAIINLKTQDLHEKDRRYVIETKRYIHEAKHYVLPDGGTIMNDGWKGLSDTILRLPYPIITIESFIPANHTNNLDIDDVNEGPARKRFVIAIDILQYNAEYSDAPFEELDGIMVFPITNVGGIWAPHMVALLLPSDWYSKCTKDGNTDIGGWEIIQYSEQFITTPALFKEAASRTPNISRKDLINMLIIDTLSDVNMILELVEALSCSNIKEVIYQPVSKLNAKRIKKNKVPILETLFLTVDVSNRPRISGNLKITDRKKPHEHLRAGHIRRYKDGHKLWINKMVVAAGNGLPIDKIYKIKK